MVNVETNQGTSPAGDKFAQEFDKLSISSNLLILPNSFLKIANISKVSAYEYKRPSYILAALYFIAAIAVISIAYIVFDNVPTHKKDDAVAAVFLIGGIIVWGILGFAYEKLTLKIAGVLIQTNGGTSDLLVTRDKEKAKKLYETMAYHIANQSMDKAISIYNSLNVTYGDSILGDKFCDIKNSTITNRSTIK